jgi:hypothetical protein
VTASRLTRRDLVQRSLVTAAGISLGAGIGAFRPMSARAASAPVCVLGAFSDAGITGGGHTIQRLASQLGHPLHGWRSNADFDKGFPGGACRDAFDFGMHWTYRDAGTGMPRLSKDAKWAAVAAGNYDSVIDQAARAINADKRWTASRPFHLSFNHEMSIEATGSPGNKPGAGILGTPLDYIKAFRHVRRVFDAAGATVSHGGNVLFCYVPLLSHFPGVPGGATTNRADQMDPGPDFYDLVGCDFYNKKESGRLHWTTSQVPGLIAAVSGFAERRGKHWFMGEFGVAEGRPGEKAAFVSSWFSQIKKLCPGSGPGCCGAVLYSHIGALLGDQVYYMDTSASALQAFRAVAADPYFSKAP